MEAVVSTTKTGRFSAPETWLDRLDPSAAAELIAASADLALFLDESGVVRDVALGSDEIDLSGAVGRPWVDLVTSESRDKVTRTLNDAVEGKSARWREINLLQAEGADVPVRFLAFPISGGDAGAGTIALGRDLRGLSRLQQKVVDLQRSMDRQYQRLRSAETRYRLLFQMSAEAVVIVDAASRRVSEANGAAAVLLGLPANRIVGRTIEDLFTTASGMALDEAASAARAVGRADPVRLKPIGDQAEVLAAFSAFRQDGGTYILVRLAREEDRDRLEPPRTGTGRALEVLRTFPEAFVMIDVDRRVVEANESFVTLTELASLDQARGQRLDRWLGRPGVDVELIVSNLKEHGSLRDFSTILRGEYGAQEEVEITAVSIPGPSGTAYSLMIRTLPEHRPITAPRESDLSRSVGQLTELVGRVSLKDLVRETTDLVEQMCIQAALNLTGDNRASAAQILGLSRQGLYAKLRRYGIGDPESETPGDEDPAVGEPSNGHRR